MTSKALINKMHMASSASNLNTDENQVSMDVLLKIVLLSNSQSTGYNTYILFLTHVKVSKT